MAASKGMLAFATKRCIQLQMKIWFFISTKQYQQFETMRERKRWERGVE